jgi:hypothetical protein
MKNLKTSVVEETTLGVFVWEMPDGRWVGDDNGNYLSIQGFKGDRTRVNVLTEVVKGYGIHTGSPKFLSGQRKINDEEYQEQIQRLNWGLTPDPLDIGEYKDILKNLRKD